MNAEAPYGLTRLMAFLIDLAKKRAYGIVRLTFADGKITAVHVEQSFRIEDLPVSRQQPPHHDAHDTPADRAVLREHP